MYKPSPPRATIDVSGMNDTSFTLSWQEPESDGGTKIIEYILEPLRDWLLPHLLKISDVRILQAEVLLSDWEIPAHNGGSEITGYCIEKRSSTSTTWTKVITLDAHCLQYTVDN
ncbi:Titin [Lucilia cuprina]|nr:Titin [Lucilia cuprina]